MPLALDPVVLSGEPGAIAAKMKPPSRFGDKAFEALTLAMALVVVETHSPPARVVHVNSILLPKVIDDLKLMLVHPPADSDQNEPK